MAPINCPRCQTPLRERERETAGRSIIVLDVCPSCGGIWLDQGELQKLTESERRYYDDDDDDDDDDRRHRGYGNDRPREYGDRPQQQYGRPKKKSSFLSNIFESFGGEGGG